MADEEALAAVVLTGGTGARLGGADKAALEVGGRTLLEHALSAVAGSAEVVVVGTPATTDRTVTWTREDPPGGGPAAALLAGLDALAGPAPWVLALAVDMPHVSPATVARLRRAAASESGDGAVLVDATGRQQFLAAVYRRAALQAARPATRAEEDGLPMRVLLRPLRLVEVPATEAEVTDVDTWSDLEAVRRAAAGSSGTAEGLHGRGSA